MKQQQPQNKTLGTLRLIAALLFIVIIQLGILTALQVNQSSETAQTGTLNPDTQASVDAFWTAFWNTPMEHYSTQLALTPSPAQGG